MFETLQQTVAPKHTAVLVIDVQNDFCQDEPRRAMIAPITRLLEHARTSGACIVYVQNTVLPRGRSDSDADLSRRLRLGINPNVTIEGTWGQRFVDAIAPEPDDPIVRKHRLSAFIGTTLDTVLRSNRIETVVCLGTATHGCVINTAYAGIALNYYVVVVEDCVASWRPELHDAALFLMRNTVNYVVSSEELVSAW